MSIIQAKFKWGQVLELIPHGMVAVFVGISLVPLMPAGLVALVPPHMLQVILLSFGVGGVGVRRRMTCAGLELAWIVALKSIFTTPAIPHQMAFWVLLLLLLGASSSMIL
jgi:hypothetical protein